MAVPSGSRRCCDGLPFSRTTPSWLMPTLLRWSAHAVSASPSGTANAKWWSVPAFALPAPSA